MGQPLSKLDALGRTVANAQDQQLRQVELSTAERLVTAARRRRRWPWRRHGALSLAAAAVVAVLALWLWPRTLTFSIGEQALPGAVDEWIAAPNGRAVPLRFSDGTAMVLSPSARARVTYADDSGAKLVVERGQVEADVVPRPGSSWQLLFGPYQVRVTGTRFSASWSPEHQQLDVDLQEGSLLVLGPALGGGQALTAGTVLQVSAIERQATIRSADTPIAAPTEPSSAPSQQPAADAGPLAPAPTGSIDDVSLPRPAPRPRWQALYHAGKYRQALSAAKGQGFESLCAEAGSAELMMLAETARYGGEPALAARAFTGLRKRHAGTNHAAVAAFHLGTIAFDLRGAYGEAAQWFGTYLAEQPGGALAQEAAGRLLEARQRAGDVAGARAAAEGYLKAYPDGPHAATARQLVAEADER